MSLSDFSPRSALFVPANRERAIEKARDLGADLVIFDLEDAVAADAKEEARANLSAILAKGYGSQKWGVRLNTTDSREFALDINFAVAVQAPLIVLPKIEVPADLDPLSGVKGSVWVMIETARGVLNASAIAYHPKVEGLIAGTNDLAASLRLPPGPRRAALAVCLQIVVLAARAANIVALDGVFNGLDDAQGLEDECCDGRRLGFDGKTLIHPTQVDSANRIFGPSEEEISVARALIAAAGGGAQRYEGQMIEDLHVAEAQRIIARAGLYPDAVGRA